MSNAARATRTEGDDRIERGEVTLTLLRNAREGRAIRIEHTGMR